MEKIAEINLGAIARVSESDSERGRDGERGSRSLVGIAADRFSRERTIQLVGRVVRAEYYALR